MSNANKIQYRQVGDYLILTSFSHPKKLISPLVNGV